MSWLPRWNETLWNKIDTIVLFAISRITYFAFLKVVALDQATQLSDNASTCFNTSSTTLRSRSSAIDPYADGYGVTSKAVFWSIFDQFHCHQRNKLILSPLFGFSGRAGYIDTTQTTAMKVWFFSLDYREGKGYLVHLGSFGCCRTVRPRMRNVKTFRPCRYCGPLWTLNGGGSPDSSPLTVWIQTRLSNPNVSSF